MELGQTLRVCDLFDVYGLLLSQKQQELMHEHFYMDRSLTEIAANLCISRQAVLDSVSKSVAKLEEFEAKLHLLEIAKEVSKLDCDGQNKIILDNLKKLL